MCPAAAVTTSAQGLPWGLVSTRFRLYAHASGHPPGAAAGAARGVRSAVPPPQAHVGSGEENNTGGMESKGMREKRREMLQRELASWLHLVGQGTRGWLCDSSEGRVRELRVPEQRPEERQQESRASSRNLEAVRVVLKRDALPDPQPAGRAPAGELQAAVFTVAICCRPGSLRNVNFLCHWLRGFQAGF